MTQKKRVVFVKHTLHKLTFKQEMIPLTTRSSWFVNEFANKWFAYAVPSNRDTYFTSSPWRQKRPCIFFMNCTGIPKIWNRFSLFPLLHCRALFLNFFSDTSECKDSSKQNF